MALRVQLSTTADDAAIRGLLRRQPMPGRIRLGYEREPDFSLGCRVTGEACRTLVARAGDRDDVVAVACRSARLMYVNGVERRLGYLGQLRVDERYRGRWLVSRGFAALRRVHEDDPLPAYLAAIVEDNREAVGVLVDKPRKHFPAFREAARFHTFAIAIRRSREPLRRARPPLRSAARLAGSGEDPVHGAARIAGCDEVPLGDVASFLREHGARRQFFPAWTEASLRTLTDFGLRLEDLRVARKDGAIVGTAGLWDQSAFKQTIVRGYSGWLRAAAPLTRIGAPWLARPCLPRPGERLRSAYAAFVCVANDDREVFAALLRELYNLARSRGLDYLLIGLDPRDPLAAVVHAYPHVLYPSRLYLAEWPDGGRLHEQLDDRPAYVDIATL